MMSKVIIENCGDVAILRLKDGIINALSLEMVKDLSMALNQVRDKYRGMVLAGGDKFFSMGFNLPELIKFDLSKITDFFDKFNQLTVDLFTFPLPVACAIGGHAIAGGNILVLTSDFRFVASGKKLIGLNEVKLGLPAPYLADLMLRQIVADRAATDMLYYGEFISSTKARQIGLVDDIFAQEELENRAVKKVAELASFPQQAFSAIKSNRVEEVMRRYEANSKSKNQIFIDCWFSESTQELLADAAKKF